MLLSVTSFLAVFTVVVLVHEFGHFVAARRAGVKVYEFSIGFPISPRIITLFRQRETEFTLRLLPLGGFVSFSRGGDEETVELFKASYLNRALILSAGSLFNIAFSFIVFIPVFLFGQHLPLSDALLHSVRMVGAVISATILFVGDLFTGAGSVDGLVGPVGIASLAGQAAGRGFLSLMSFTGMLGLSLGIINMLPLPAFDGGQLILLLVEAVKRKPLNLLTHQFFNVFGLILILILTLFVTWNDITRLIG